MKQLKQRVMLLFTTGVILSAMLMTACNGIKTESITLHTNNAKTVFAIGEEFSAQGVTVTANLSDGTTKAVPISDCAVSEPDMHTEGEKSVTVKYDGKSAIYTITVSATEATVSYQFTGGIYDMAANGIIFEFLGNLMSDGRGALYVYAMGSVFQGISDFDAQWTCEEDRDGVVTMELHIDGTKYTIYQDADESFQLEYNYVFNSGSNSRKVDLMGTATVLFDTIEKWTADCDETNAGKLNPGTDPGTDPEPGEIKFSFYGDAVQKENGETIANCAVAVKLFGDGTAFAQRGYAMGGTIYQNYEEQEGTWMQNGDTLTILLEGTTYTAEKKDGTYAFVWSIVSETDGLLTALVTLVG